MLYQQIKKKVSFFLRGFYGPGAAGNSRAWNQAVFEGFPNFMEMGSFGQKHKYDFLSVKCKEVTFVVGGRFLSKFM